MFFTEKGLRKRVKIWMTLLLTACLALATQAQADSLTLWASSAGDGTYSWNTKYGPYGWNTTSQTMSTKFQMGGTYGNDITNIYIEIPISPLQGQTVTSATLVLDSAGAGTGYYYGSASIKYLNPGSNTPTGNVSADSPNAWTAGTGWTIYNSYSGPPWDGSPGLKSFDVLSLVQADLTAGLNFITFALSSSRDTDITIYASDSIDPAHEGPRIVAEFAAAPLPPGFLLLGTGLFGLLGLQRFRKQLNAVTEETSKGRVGCAPAFFIKQM